MSEEERFELSPLEPTMKNAILSHCHECMGHYYDGKVDCENIVCQFYKWMPQAAYLPDLEWTKYNPKKCGKVLKKRKILNDEEKAVINERFGHSKKKKGKKKK